ncbi:MAG: aminopeptidase P family protein [Hyphomicrobium sp.]|mgnify:CR=1 FL=1
MFQTFDATPSPQASSERVKRLRVLLLERGLKGFLVPRADEHQGEYVPPSAERLKWLTGFSGSAGLAVVTSKHAAVFTDGRYTAQVRSEVDGTLFDFPGLARTQLTGWLTTNCQSGDVIGFDPWLHTAGEIGRLTQALKLHGIKLKPVKNNLADRIWGTGRPAPPRNPILPHPIEFSGRSAADKISAIAKELKTAGQDALVLTLPDSICWLFNIRGSDVAHNPVVLAFAIVPAQGKPELFVIPEKNSKEARAHLDGVVKLSKPEKMAEKLKALKKSGKRVRIDPETAAWWFTHTLGPKSAVRGPDPCIALKAIKNNIEIEGARAAHVRDGAAMCTFLAWLDSAAGDGTVDEISAVRKLEEARIATGALKEISFDTISGSGPNGAIVHYRVSQQTNRQLQQGELFLLDSGAQYADGTTDITRTIAIGQPSPEMRERFTLVLKGHIAIATARFPKGTRGIDLDPFARKALWDMGLDYDHGTGHGVGSYLSVHEGPQSISRAGMAVLEPGMICSNEPGYYKAGTYGIRIENLVLVSEAEIPPRGERPAMSFETLTLVPIDRRLIDISLLDRNELTWLNAYHARVRATIGPLVDPSAREWLTASTGPL